MPRRAQPRLRSAGLGAFLEEPRCRGVPDWVGAPHGHAPLTKWTSLALEHAPHGCGRQARPCVGPSHPRPGPRPRPTDRLHATGQAARAKGWPSCAAPSGPDGLAWAPPPPLHMLCRERAGGGARGGGARPQALREWPNAGMAGCGVARAAEWRHAARALQLHAAQSFVLAPESPVRGTWREPFLPAAAPALARPRPVLAPALSTAPPVARCAPCGTKHIQSCPVLPCPVLSYPILSYPISACRPRRRRGACRGGGPPAGGAAGRVAGRGGGGGAV